MEPADRPLSAGEFFRRRPQAGKQHCKSALRDYFFQGQVQDTTRPVFGFVGRLVEQKGIDLILAVIEDIIQDTNADFVFLGSGNSYYENQLRILATRYPDRIGVSTRFSEELAHRIEAGADFFLMPSRFEPCGLNQMYSMIYGTPPIVNNTGGLADTVTDSTPETLSEGSATGFVMDGASADSLSAAIRRALEQYRQPESWQKIIQNGMTHDFSWDQRARQYLELYSH